MRRGNARIWFASDPISRRKDAWRALDSNCRYPQRQTPGIAGRFRVSDLQVLRIFARSMRTYSRWREVGGGRWRAGGNVTLKVALHDRGKA